MRSVWWYIKWIVIGVLIGVFCLFLYKKFIIKEGFQTISNIQYNFKEVFLVAPNTVSQTGNAVGTLSRTSDLQYTNQGYTWEDAQRICRGYKGDLATLEQVEKAYDNSGNWCPAGWILDSRDTVYYLPRNPYNCGDTAPTAIRSRNAARDSTGSKKAFAICYAVKPFEPSISVHKFNSTEYSMIPSNMLNNIMYGRGTDIFPIQFTASQAYYGADRVGVNSITRRYNDGDIRRWLINNYNSLDANILESERYTDDPSNWNTLAKVNQQSCSLIQNKDNLISQKIIDIKKAFEDVSGYVIASIKSKAENSNIQALLYNICSKTDPIESPACAKLATLDFDMYYTNSVYNTLADLQTLNIEIYGRRDEICRILYSIRILKSILNCNYIPLIAECSKGCNITPTTATKVGSFDCSGSDIFDLNNVGQLAYSLEEISPLFDVPAYSSILKSVLENLSYIVETPNLVSTVDSDQNLKLIETAIGSIRQLITTANVNHNANTNYIPPST
jgi:hypothetical protein